MAKIRVIGRSYVIDYYDRNGERHRDTLGKVGVISAKEAERFKQRVELELSPAFAALNPPAVRTFAEFVDDYLAWHAAEYPTSHYRVKQIVEDYLLPTFQYDRLDALAPKRVEQWKQHRLAPRKDAPKSQTVTKELRTLKAILNRAVEWKELKENPIGRVAAPRQLDSKPPRFFTTEELAAIYAACCITVNKGEGPQPNPLHAHMWRLYANTGLRRTEGLILKRAWVGQSAMKILSTDEDRTKSGKWREIPLTDGALDALDGLKGQGEFVMPRMTLPSLSRACARDISRAGIEDGSLHTMRHTYCSHLVMAGVPLRTVQKLAGHSTIKITENYAHLAPDYLTNEGRRISL